MFSQIKQHVAWIQQHDSAAFVADTELECATELPRVQRLPLAAESPAPVMITTDLSAFNSAESSARVAPMPRTLLRWLRVLGPLIAAQSAETEPEVEQLVSLVRASLELPQLIT